MTDEDNKITITIRRGSDGPPGVIEADCYVLVSLAIGEDESGTSRTYVSAPPGEETPYLYMAARAIAQALNQVGHPLATALGSVMDNTLRETVGHFEKALEVGES